MELFNQYDRIALLKLDSIYDSTKVLETQVIYTTLIHTVKGNWSARPVGEICTNCPCSGSISKERIGDTLVVFLESGPADKFELAPCSLWHFLVTGYLSQRQQFMYQYTHPVGDTIKTYYSNGQLTAKGVLNKAGEPAGYWEYYTFDGKLKSAGTYKKGVKNGDWIEYRFREEIKESGRAYLPEIYAKGSYENGVQTGTWNWYSPDGKMISTTGKIP